MSRLKSSERRFKWCAKRARRSNSSKEKSIDNCTLVWIWNINSEYKHAAKDDQTTTTKEASKFSQFGFHIPVMLNHIDDECKHQYIYAQDEMQRNGKKIRRPLSSMCYKDRFMCDCHSPATVPTLEFIHNWEKEKATFFFEKFSLADKRRRQRTDLFVSISSEMYSLPFDIAIRERCAMCIGVNAFVAFFSSFYTGSARFLLLIHRRLLFFMYIDFVEILFIKSSQAFHCNSRFHTEKCFTWFLKKKILNEYASSRFDWCRVKSTIFFAYSKMRIDLIPIIARFHFFFSNRDDFENSALCFVNFW